jgi:hypothetical protein
MLASTEGKLLALFPCPELNGGELISASESNEFYY